MHSFAILGAGSDALKAAGSLCRLCGQTMGREKIPLSRAVLQVDLFTVQITIWTEIALKRPAWPCTPVHNKEQVSLHTHTHTRTPRLTHTPLTSHTHTHTAHEHLLVSHTHCAAAHSDGCSFGFMFQISSGNVKEMTL